MGHWIAVRLEQPGPNRDAIGSWIEVRVGDRTIQREVTVGGGHASGQLGWIHFGLGRCRRGRGPGALARRRDGPWLDVDADQFATIERGATRAAHRGSRTD